MARQEMGGCITGTIGNLTFYKMDGKYYVRAKSTITKRKIKRNPAFKRFLENSQEFGKASKMASRMYHTLIPKENRYSGLFGKVCAEVNRMLKAGKSKEEIEMTVRERFGEKEVGKLTGLQVDKVGAKVSKSLVNESFKDEG